jgi:hypothetical protein
VPCFRIRGLSHAIDRRTIRYPYVDYRDKPVRVILDVEDGEDRLGVSHFQDLVIADSPPAYALVAANKTICAWRALVGQLIYRGLSCGCNRADLIRCIERKPHFTVGTCCDVCRDGS